jgi:hypothetical protein
MADTSDVPVITVILGDDVSTQPVREVNNKTSARMPGIKKLFFKVTPLKIDYLFEKQRLT